MRCPYLNLSGPISSYLTIRGLGYLHIMQSISTRRNFDIDIFESIQSLGNWSCEQPIYEGKGCFNQPYEGMIGFWDLTKDGRF